MSRDTASQLARLLHLRTDLVMVAGGAVLYLLLISIAYTHDFEFNCRAALADGFCSALSGAVPRALSVIALLGLTAAVRPALMTDLSAILRPTLSRKGLALSTAGMGVILLPWLGVSVLTAPMSAVGMATLWVVGLAMAVAGLVMALVPPRALADTLSPVAGLLAMVIGLGLVLPDVALALQPVWRTEWITDLTFNTVIASLNLLGQNVMSDASVKLIGIDEFAVLVGPQCSGVEGLALITVFLATYIVLFRDRLHLGRALLLFPIGLVASWVLNSVRITILLIIGRYISPDLAVEGFHSHAGWLMFMTLSVVLAATAHRVRWLQRAETGPVVTVETTSRPDFFADPMTVLILPFAAFMATATLTSAISETPALLYPLRMAVVVALLGLGWSFVRALPWRIDRLSLGTGLACGVLWLVTAPPAGAGDTLLSARLAELPALVLAGWVLARLLGTALVVPVVEEFFFRGYILARLDRGGIGWRLLALAVSTGIFAAMHDRYIAGALAGLLFGLIYLRRRNLADAVVCHAAANALIAGWALTHGDFSVI